MVKDSDSLQKLIQKAFELGASDACCCAGSRIMGGDEGTSKKYKFSFEANTEDITLMFRR